MKNKKKKDLCEKKSSELLNMFYVCSAVLDMQILYCMGG